MIQQTAQIITKGRNAEAVILVFALAAVLVILYLTGRTKWKAHIRRLPVMDGIDEAVARSAETGKMFFYGTGGGVMDRASGASITLASLGILSYIARQCAKYNVPLRIGLLVPETVPMADDICRAAYTAEGKLEAYNPNETIMFFGGGGATHCMGWLRRNPVGGMAVIGEIRGDCHQYYEAAAGRGMIQIGGTPSGTNLQWIIMENDYNVIGEECFAAAAYCTEDPMQLNTLFGSDILKYLVIGLTVLGLVVTLAGSGILYGLLTV